MFLANFFARRYFAPMYFPEVGAATADGGYFPGVFFGARFFAPHYFPKTGTTPGSGSASTTEGERWPRLLAIFSRMGCR